MIFTLGHSTLTIPGFLLACRSVRLDVIVDTRSHPVSNHVPHFNNKAMTDWLPAAGIDYQWRPELGGWDTRHDEPDLLLEYQRVGVDVSAYTRGVFPRQRIGRATSKSSLDQYPGAWTNQGLYDFAWYTARDEFQGALTQLVRDFNMPHWHGAVICCEAQWWKCHRSMIADNLYFRGIPCFHLPTVPPKRPTTRKYKSHGDAIGNRLGRYPAPVLQSWSAAMPVYV